MQFVSSIIHVFIILREQRGQGVSNKHIKRMIIVDVGRWGHGKIMVMPFNCMTERETPGGPWISFSCPGHNMQDPSDIQGRNIRSRYTAELIGQLHVRLYFERERSILWR